MKLRHGLGTLAITLAILCALPLVALILGAEIDDVTAALSDADVLSATAVSLGCATAAVAIGAALGVPAGYLMAKRRIRGARYLRALFDLPLVVPHPIIGIGLLLVFGRNQLVGAALTEGLGVQVASAAPGIIIAMIVVSAPLTVKSAFDGFAAVPNALERTARSLGASEGRAFRTVSLPLALPNIRSGLLLAWARSISEFGSIAIIAYYPRTAPVLIWDRFTAYGMRAAIAPALLLLAICLTVFILLQRFQSAGSDPQSQR